MNFDLLSKNAESYSSASITNISSVPSEADPEILSEMPPTKNPISFPWSKNMCVSIYEVVVFP